MLKNAGLVEHPNCIPFLATSQANVKSKAQGELEALDYIVVKLPDEPKPSPEDIKLNLKTEAQKFDEVRKPFLQKIKLEKEKLKRLEDYIKLFKNRDTVHLKVIDQGCYNVIAARKEHTQYGYQYKLLVELNNDLSIVWGNKRITDIIDSLTEHQLAMLKDEDTGYLVLLDRTLLGEHLTNMEI